MARSPIEAPRGPLTGLLYLGAVADASPTTPGADRVAHGIERLPLRTPTLPPATHTNAYLVGTDEVVLVEPASPYPDEVDRAVAWVESARSEGRRPRAILVTHHHPDHVGGATSLAERLGLPLWGHPETAALLEGQVTFDALLRDGDEVVLAGRAPGGPLTIRCLHTPGHAPGHLCFYLPATGAMIAGDMVAGVGTILIAPGDGNMGRYLASLRRMKAVGPDVLLPAHGEPIRDPARCLDHYVAHRLAREVRVVEALAERDGPATPAELVPTAYADAPRSVWGLAAVSTEAHLIDLERQGRVVRTGDRWALP